VTRRLVAAAAALALAGCYTIRYERRSTLPEPGAPRQVWHHGFVGGSLLGSAPIDLPAMCPTGVAVVESQITFLNWLGQVVSCFGGLCAIWAPAWEPQTVSVTCARPAVATVTRRVKVAMLPLTALGGVSKETTQLLGDALAGELRRRPGISVLTPSDVAALLGAERTRQMLGCTDSGCIAELGGALGADRVVHGSIGRVGDSLVVNLAALDPRRAVTVASVSERLRGGGEEAFLDALPILADGLLTDGGGTAPSGNVR
jgi:hypothetical protein